MKRKNIQMCLLSYLVIYFRLLGWPVASGNTISARGFHFSFGNCNSLHIHETSMNLEQQTQLHYAFMCHFYI